jgi:DNA-directed RNA polymerase subunit RPC12/RpoP
MQTEFDRASSTVAQPVFCPVCATVDERSGEAYVCNNCETEYTLAHVAERFREGEFEGAQIVCPHCSKRVDAEGLGWLNYLCPHDECYQEFAVDLEAEKLAEYALFG